jgi:hypothetical protein
MEQQDSAVLEAGDGLQPGEKSATQLKKEAKKKDKLEKFQAKKEKVVVQPVQLKTEDKTKVKKEENEDDFMLDPEHVPGQFGNLPSGSSQCRVHTACSFIHFYFSRCEEKYSLPFSTILSSGICRGSLVFVVGEGRLFQTRIYGETSS